MKQILLALTLIVAGSAAAYVVAGKRAAARAELIRIQEIEGLQSEIAKLQEEVRDSRRRPAEVRTVTETVEVAVASGDSAETVIARLVEIRPTVGVSRNVMLRQVIHELESLNRLGPAALPAIRTFMARNEDLDYTVSAAVESESGDSSENEGRGTRGRGGDRDNLFSALSSSRWRNGSRSLPSTDFLAPPSLRLGLVNVLTEIGGKESEAILAEILQTTGRGIEVAYVTRALEDVAPGQYRDHAVAAAHELLTNPVTLDNSSRLDESSKRYLYGILYMYEDKSFAGTAQTLVVGTGGRIDRTVLSYVNWAYGDQAMSAIYNVYMDPRLTNRNDRAQIAMSSLKFVGANAQADQVFKQMVSDSEGSGMARAMAVMSLATGGMGSSRGEPPTDLNVIRARMDLLENSRQYFDDERSIRMLDRTAETLEKLYNGEEVDTSMRGMFGGRGGDRGGRGGR